MDIMRDSRPQGKLQFVRKLSDGDGNTGGNSQTKIIVTDRSGDLWVLKADRGPIELQTGADVIASQIYRSLGYAAVRSYIVQFEGQRYAATSYLGNRLPLDRFLNDINTPEFRQLRIFASFLKDWDRLRGTHNLALGKGKFGIMDFGGTLGSKALGDPKPGDAFSQQVGTFEPTNNGQKILEDFHVDWILKSHAWHKLTVKDLKSAAASLRTLTNNEMKKIVQSAEYSDARDSQYLLQSLIIRRNALIEFLESQRAVAWLKSKDEKFDVENDIVQSPEETPYYASKRPSVDENSESAPTFTGSDKSILRDLKGDAVISSYLMARSVIEDSKPIKQPKAIAEQSNKLILDYIKNGVYERFSNEDLGTLRTYVDSGSKWKAMNNWLSTKEGSRLYSVENLKKFHDSLTTVMKKTEGADHPNDFNRGAVMKSTKYLNAVGKTFRASRMWSTTVDPAIAKEFATPDRDHPDYSSDLITVVYKIKLAKKHVTGVFIPGLLWIYNKKNSGAMPVSPNILHEEEFLIHDQTKFKVVRSRESRTKDGFRYIEQELELAD
ncbi:MAG: hypothetical protein AB7O96_18295 [Pseudobdellovibrionaceae bacterium]